MLYVGLDMIKCIFPPGRAVHMLSEDGKYCHYACWVKITVNDENAVGMSMLSLVYGAV